MAAWTNVPSRLIKDEENRVEWIIRLILYDGSSTQDFDGIFENEYYYDTKEKAENDIGKIVKKNKELLNDNGKPRYVSICAIIKEKTSEGETEIKRLHIVYESNIREELITIRPGRGWLDKKRTEEISMEMERQLKNGSYQRKAIISKCENI